MIRLTVFAVLFGIGTASLATVSFVDPASAATRHSTQSGRRPVSRLAQLRGHDVLPQRSSKNSALAASAPAAQVALRPRQQAIWKQH
jgi:hypothetical protein